MREYKRIFINKIFIGLAILLLTCHTAVYIYNEAASVDSISDYARHINELGAKMSELSPEQGIELLDKEYKNNMGWLVAEFIVSRGQYDDTDFMADYRERYPDIDNMIKIILSGAAHAEYDSTLNNAIDTWRTQLNYEIEYNGRIKNIAKQAERIQKNPLFSKPGSFDYRNASKTAADYNKITDVQVGRYTNNVMNSIMNNKTGQLFSICLIAITVIFMLEPRRLGLSNIERAAANGRTVITLHRIFALLIAAAASVLLITGSMLISGMLIYRQTVPFGMSLQSIPFFQDWTSHATIGSFFIWLFLFKTAGLWLAGLMLWFVLSRIRSLPFGIIIVGAFLLIENYWFNRYGVNDSLHYLASFNIMHLLSAEAAAGRYYNYNMFGYPVNERTFLAALFVLLLLAMIALLILTSHFTKEGRRSGRLHAVMQLAAERLRKLRPPLPLWCYEARKVFIYGGGIVIIAACLLFVWVQHAPAKDTDAVERLLYKYTRDYAGPIGIDTYNIIIRLSEEADREYAEYIDNMNSGNTPSESETEYGDSSLQLQYLMNRSRALEMLKERYGILLDMEKNGTEGIWLTDDMPLERIYGDTGLTLRINEAIAVMLALCFTLPSAFLHESRNKMRITLKSSARGRGPLWMNKWLISMTAALVMWGIWIFKELLLLRSTGIVWSSLKACGRSLIFWNEALGTLPVWAYIVIFYLVRLVGLLAACGIIMLISVKWPAFLQAGFASSAVLLSAAVLYIIGMKWIAPASWCIYTAGMTFNVNISTCIWLCIWGIIGAGGIIASRRLWGGYRS